MARRPLPTPQEAAEILKRRRTRPARRPPAPMGRSLAPLIKALDAKYGHGPGALQARWKEIVGEVLARRSEPMKIVKSRPTSTGKGGATLELKVDGPAATLVQHQAPEIIARLDLILGQGAVTRLRIVQGPVRTGARDTASQTPRRRKATPLDAAAEAELAQGLATQPDGPLKDALTRLGRAVLRQDR